MNTEDYVTCKWYARWQEVFGGGCDISKSDYSTGGFHEIYIYIYNIWMAGGAAG